jgi:hypothetical protein
MDIRAEPDGLARQLRADDPSTWTCTALADALGFQPRPRP